MVKLVGHIGCNNGNKGSYSERLSGIVANATIAIVHVEIQMTRVTTVGTVAAVRKATHTG